MIYEGPCDTEDWNDDAENSACITEINHSLKYIKNENRYLKLYLNLYCIFDQINAALVSIQGSLAFLPAIIAFLLWLIPA